MRQDLSISSLGPVPVSAAPLAHVDGHAVNVGSMGQAVDSAIRHAKAGLAFTFYTLNLDHLVKLRADPRFRKAYARADLVSADGGPVVALARRQGVHLERTTGADLVAPLCEAAAREGIPVFLFGSSETSLDGACRRLHEQFPLLDVRACEAPPQGFDPFSAEADAAGDRIAASGARLCFVALGAPKQEFFADRMAARLDGVGWICVGAALDFLAGRQRRAPLWVQRMGMEWVYRCLSSPRRLGLRYARCAWLYARLRLSAGRLDRPVVDQPSPA